jgi:tRNA threonylcarbamoyladenosine biosynthesis protein TsaE
MKKYITKSDKETKQLAEKIIGKYINSKSKTTVIFLFGSLGAGKTVFIKGIAHKLGTKEEVESPTFVFVKEYQTTPPLYHFDLYRIESPNELDELGFFDYLERNGIVAIEWAEKIRDFVKADIEVRIKKTGETTREIEITENNDENFSH